MTGTVDGDAAAQLLARWWSAYDEGSFDELHALLDDDAHFQCRTDTGTTDFEEFVRAECHGRDEIMRWQTEHRLDSPYPLRHHMTNFHLTATEGDLVRFRHYLVTSEVRDVNPAPLPGGVVIGAVKHRDDELLIADLVVVLDTRDSVPLRDLRS